MEQILQILVMETKKSICLFLIKNHSSSFLTAIISKKNVEKVRNRQRFRVTVREIENSCDNSRCSWKNEILIEQSFSDMGPDCWVTYSPDCLLSSTDFRDYSLASERTDEEKDFLKNFRKSLT